MNGSFSVRSSAFCMRFYDPRSRAAMEDTLFYQTGFLLFRASKKGDASQQTSYQPTPAVIPSEAERQRNGTEGSESGLHNPAFKISRLRFAFGSASLEMTKRACVIMITALSLRETACVLRACPIRGMRGPGRQCRSGRVGSILRQRPDRCPESSGMHTFPFSVEQ